MRRLPWCMLLMALAGCAVSPDAPPSLRYGERPCAQCRMLVSDERFAVAIVDRDGQWRYFDGLGCAGAYVASQQPPPRRIWVQDYESSAWLDALTAAYVRSPEVEAPMGEGLLAVSSADRAAALADALHGQVVAAREVFGAVITSVAAATAVDTTTRE